MTERPHGLAASAVRVKQAPPAGLGPGGARASPAKLPGARTTGRSAGGPILVVVALLAVLGIGAWLVVQRTAAPPPVARVGPAHDPRRVYVVAEAIDHRQMRPVWNLLNMSGIEQLCEKARAFTVSREADGPGAVPTHFIVYCRGQGFWAVQSDPSRERWGTVGPLATREDVEAVIDRGGEFIWGARPPGQRSFVGGLAPDR